MTEFQMITEALGKVYDVEEAWDTKNHPMAAMSATKPHKSLTPKEKADLKKKRAKSSSAHTPAMSSQDWAAATGGKYTKENIEYVYSMMLEGEDLDSISEATGITLESLSALCAKPAFISTPTGKANCKVGAKPVPQKPQAGLYNKDKAGIRNAAKRVGLTASYNPELANEETVKGIAEAFGGDQRELLILGLALINEAGVPALTEAVGIIYENAEEKGLLG